MDQDHVDISMCLPRSSVSMTSGPETRLIPLDAEIGRSGRLNGGDDDIASYKTNVNKCGVER